MNIHVSTTLLLAMSLGTIQAQQEKSLADFKTEATTLSWRTINDTVMGGISKGDSFVTEASHLIFKGNISLENNGGFSSIRTFGHSFNLSDYDGVELMVKGDGRKYFLTSRSNGKRMLAFWSPIQPEKDEWVKVKIPFQTFYATSFGRRIPGLKLDMKDITSLGFMMYDKKPGDFQLEVKSIKVYKNTNK